LAQAEQAQLLDRTQLLVVTLAVMAAIVYLDHYLQQAVVAVVGIVPQAKQADLVAVLLVTQDQVLVLAQLDRDLQVDPAIALAAMRLVVVVALAAQDNRE
jgi:hypothetical protein